MSDIVVNPAGKLGVAVSDKPAGSLHPSPARKFRQTYPFGAIRRFAAASFLALYAKWRKSWAAADAEKRGRMLGSVS